ncbi:unnamed protein product [Timema podura]|uniref:Uncharacterized protein n=1 Tax=Timema podura TaxID=61482 RepID=A0ABN7PG12_TIMPD|nr:unnamed protein product [Timema podura]
MVFILKEKSFPRGGAKPFSRVSKFNLFKGESAKKKQKLNAKNKRDAVTRNVKVLKEKQEQPPGSSREIFGVTPLSYKKYGNLFAAIVSRVKL